MFLEPHFRGQRTGWIEVICGPMFSGKTEELIRRLKRARIAGQEVVVFKPRTDTRFSADRVVSHDENVLQSKPVESPAEMLAIDDSVDVVGIDEAQFFPDDLVGACEGLARRGIRVILAGLDMDFKGRPFGPMPFVLAVAEYVTKVHAICPHCGSLATHSFRLSEESETVVLGEKGQYEPRCRTCFSMGNILNLKVPKPKA
jgi:thymidine kinase